MNGFCDFCKYLKPGYEHSYNCLFYDIPIYDNTASDDCACYDERDKA